MVYEAKVSKENNFKSSYGTCEGKFQFSLKNHTKSFPDRGNETDLSKYICQLKDESKNYNIRWEIFMYAASYKWGSRLCYLCLTEKYVIAREKSRTLTKQKN